MFKIKIKFPTWFKIALGVLIGALLGIMIALLIILRQGER
jgi:ABC-type nitrate/sulfonate/bicarbonate transport system permease component